MCINTNHQLYILYVKYQSPNGCVHVLEINDNSHLMFLKLGFKLNLCHVQFSVYAGVRFKPKLYFIHNFS
jgi:hypothetical protein